MDLRHQCMIYKGSPAMHLSGVSAALIEKLNTNFRCLYLNSPSMVAGLRSYLAAMGLDVASAVARGSLVLSSDEGHLTEGRFDLEKMLALLEDAVDKAVEDGYQGLWAAGDMTWEFGAERNFAKLEEYERRLEELFERRAELHGICLYHVDTLPVETISEALYTHRATFINETLSRINPYYFSASSPLRPAIPASFLQHVLADPICPSEA